MFLVTENVIKLAKSARNSSVFTWSKTQTIRVDNRKIIYRKINIRDSGKIFKRKKKKTLNSNKLTILIC